jgi:hypothetical protein
MVLHSLKDLRYMIFPTFYKRVLYDLRHIGASTQHFPDEHTLTKQAKRYARIQKETRISEKNVCSLLTKNKKLVCC